MDKDLGSNIRNDSDLQSDSMQPNSMERNLIVMVYAVYYLSRKVFRSHRKERRISEYICVALRKKYNSIPNKNEFITELTDQIQAQGMTEKELLSKLLELTFDMSYHQREKLLNIAENLVTFAHSQELNRIHDAFNIERNISYQIKSSVMSGISENVGIRGGVMATLTVAFILLGISMPIIGIALNDEQSISGAVVAQITPNSTPQQVSDAMNPILQRITFNKFVINGVVSQSNIVSATTNSSVYNVRGYAEVAINLDEFSYSNSVVSYHSDDNLLPFKVRVVFDNESITRIGAAQSTIEHGTGTVIPPEPLKVVATDDGWFRLKAANTNIRTTNNDAANVDAANVDANVDDANVDANNNDDANDKIALDMNKSYAPTETLFYRIKEHSKVINYFAPAAVVRSIPDAEVGNGNGMNNGNGNGNGMNNDSSNGNATNNGNGNAMNNAENTLVANIVVNTNYLIVNTLLSTEATFEGDGNSTLVANASVTGIHTNHLKEQIALSLLLNKQVYSALAMSMKVVLYAGYARNNLYVGSISIGLRSY